VVAPVKNLPPILFDNRAKFGYFFLQYCFIIRENFGYCFSYRVRDMRKILARWYPAPQYRKRVLPVETLPSPTFVTIRNFVAPGKTGWVSV